jgi:hypothetical protein
MPLPKAQNIDQKSISHIWTKNLFHNKKNKNQPITLYYQDPKKQSLYK